MNMTISGASGFGFGNNRNRESANTSLNSSKNDISMVNNLSHLNVDTTVIGQRKKAKTHYLGKSITGIFKNILK